MDNIISTIDINLRYSDTDQMGVIYHAHYLTYFEQGRTKYLEELGYQYSDIEKAGVLFPIRNVKCTYLIPIRYGEKIHLETSVLDVSKVQITYGHELINEKGQLCAKGQTSVVAVRKDDFSLFRFDKVYPELYNKYRENII